jgi:hypothetical protein
VLDPKTGKKVRLKLDDKQKQQYYDAYVQAEAAMSSAETASEGPQHQPETFGYRDAHYS